MALLAKSGLLPPISEREISDKSKADGLAKTLVCLQAIWMVVQVISRLVDGLPVTLLEVNTLGHVVCALLIYLLWWHKPRLVREPTVLQGQWVKPVCAYMWMSSKISDPKDHGNNLFGRIFYKQPRMPELQRLKIDHQEPTKEPENANSNASFAQIKHKSNALTHSAGVCQRVIYPEEPSAPLSQTENSRRV